MDTLIQFYFGLWFITFPLTLYCLAVLYIIITELLDLIFNSRRIDNLLLQSEQIDISKLENEHQHNKQVQSNLNESDINELNRQMDYLKLKHKSTQIKYAEKERIMDAKSLSDIFRLKTE